MNWRTDLFPWSFYYESLPTEMRYKRFRESDDNIIDLYFPALPNFPSVTIVIERDIRF